MHTLNFAKPYKNILFGGINKKQTVSDSPNSITIGYKEIQTSNLDDILKQKSDILSGKNNRKNILVKKTEKLFNLLIEIFKSLLNKLIIITKLPI